MAKTKSEFTKRHPCGLKYKSLRAYAGSLCTKEKGKSEAKIGDVVQILNMVSDDLFSDEAQTYIAPKFAIAKSFYRARPTDVRDLLIVTGAKRFLAELKKKKAAERARR